MQGCKKFPMQARTALEQPSIGSPHVNIISAATKVNASFIHPGTLRIRYPKGKGKANRRTN
jgi:hypothetical protein